MPEPTPSPFCPHCDRLLSLAEALLAQSSRVPCMECLLDETEDAVLSGKLTHAEEVVDAA